MGKQKKPRRLSPGKQDSDQDQPATGKDSVGSRMGVVKPTPVQPIRRDNVTGRWAPGSSGNPIGRPMKVEESFRAVAKAHSQEALDTLVQLMRHSKSAAIRKMAADSILDRAYGRPPQAISGPDGGAIPLEVGQLLLAKLKAMAVDGPLPGEDDGDGGANSGESSPAASSAGEAGRGAGGTDAGAADDRRRAGRAGEPGGDPPVQPAP